METKRKALGKGLEQLFSNERIDFDNFEKGIVEETKPNDILNIPLDEIRPNYHHVESCQQTVPEAIIAFLESKDYEDSVRNSVSLGGDTDTLAAITGGIAEAYYGIPANLKAECKDRVSEDILNVINLFEETISKNE